MGSSTTSVRGRRAGIVAILASVIRLVGGLFVLVLVAHVLLTLGHANPANDITKFVAYSAGRLQLGFSSLFIPADPRASLLIGYGLAVAFWLVVTWVLVRLVRRLH